MHCGTPGTRAPGERGAVAEKKEAFLQLGARLTGSPRRLKRFAFLSKCCQESNTNHNNTLEHLRSKRRDQVQKRRRALRERQNPYLAPQPFESPCKEPAQSLCPSPQGRKISPRRTFVDSNRCVQYRSVGFKHPVSTDVL